MPKIRVLVSKKGIAKIEAQGFQGSTCLLATKQLERALGSVEARTETEEMYHNPVTREITVDANG